MIAKKKVKQIFESGSLKLQIEHRDLELIPYFGYNHYRAIFYFCKELDLGFDNLYTFIHSIFEL